MCAAASVRFVQLLCLGVRGRVQKEVHCLISLLDDYITITGQDTVGEAVIVCKSDAGVKQAKALMSAALNPVWLTSLCISESSHKK